MHRDVLAVQLEAVAGPRFFLNGEEGGFVIKEASNAGDRDSDEILSEKFFLVSDLDELGLARGVFDRLFEQRSLQGVAPTR